MRCQGKSNGSGVRVLRAMKDLKQSDLADAAGVHQTTLSKLERGISVSQETRERIASALGLPASVLFPGKQS